MVIVGEVLVCFWGCRYVGPPPAPSFRRGWKMGVSPAEPLCISSWKGALPFFPAPPLGSRFRGNDRGWRE